MVLKKLTPQLQQTPVTAKKKKAKKTPSSEGVDQSKASQETNNRGNEDLVIEISRARCSREEKTTCSSLGSENEDLSIEVNHEDRADLGEEIDPHNSYRTC